MVAQRLRCSLPAVAVPDVRRPAASLPAGADAVAAIGPAFAAPPALGKREPKAAGDRIGLDDPKPQLLPHPVGLAALLADSCWVFSS
jgi:hypothetical protein